MKSIARFNRRTHLPFFGALLAVSLFALVTTPVQSAHALTIKIGSLTFSTSPAASTTKTTPTTAPTPTVTPTPPGQLSPANQQFVDATVNAAMQVGKVPGVSLSISGPAGNYTKAYGYANTLLKTPLSTNDHYRIGSITKLFTATAILEQVDKGKIGLDDPVSKYVSGIPNGNIITVRELLDMRSGLYDFISNPTYDVSLGLFSGLPLYSPASILNIIRSHSVLFAPNAKYSYSNSNYIVLGFILEKVTGQSAQTVITNNVIKPLGLTNTSFPSTAAIPAPYSSGYGANPVFTSLTKDYTAVYPGYVWTAGAMISTVGDMTKFANALRTGALLKPATQTQRLHFCPAPYGGGLAPTTIGYGLGLFSYGQWQGHNGSIPGFGDVMFFDPTNGAIITGMENTWDNPVSGGDFSIYETIFPTIANHLYPTSLTIPTYPSC